MSEQTPTILEVGQSGFNSHVIMASYKQPVLVEFMGVWSGPCIQLADRISESVHEFPGQFIFAKVDVDEQPELKQEYGVENVPTLKVFKDGQVVLTEEGVMEESELRAMLKSYGIYRQSDELREQARVKHMNGDTVTAIQLLTQAIQQDPSNTRVAMDMVQVMIDIDELGQAIALFNKLPERDKESEFGRILVGQLSFRQLAAKTPGKAELQQRLAENARDHDARFDLAICLVAENDYIKAMDYLFEIFEAEPEYKEGAAREMIINLCNMLAPNEPQLAQDFRRRLGNVVAQ
jgi:putative thioredoxin